MSVEDDIKRAVQGQRVIPPAAVGQQLSGRIREEDFGKLRSEVHGAILRAWSVLVPSGEWLQVDDRFRDIVDEWLKQKRG